MTASQLRPLVLFLGSLSYLFIGIIHPADLEVGDDPDLYLGLHVFQLFSIWGMALTLWFMTEGVENRATRLARAAILPYAIAYTAFDAIAGIAMGVIVQEANSMSPSDQAAMVRFLDGLDGHWAGIGLYLAAGLTWIFAVGSAIVSLKGSAPTGPLVPMFVGALIFMVGHPFPPGPVGISLFMAGLAWVELKRRSVAADVAPAPAAATTQSIRFETLP